MMHILKMIVVLILITRLNPLYAENLLQIRLKDDGHISVDIKNAPLKQVLQSIQEQNGIWFQCDETLLNQKITSSFQQMPLTEGIKKILISFNHAMIFDQSGSLRGLILVKRGGEININNEVVDLSINEQLAPPEDSPNHPAFWHNIGIMDSDKGGSMPSPAWKKPSLEELETKGPGTGPPPATGPESGRKPTQEQLEKDGPGAGRPNQKWPEFETLAP